MPPKRQGEGDSVQITRWASLSEQQFLGCVSAFADALAGELNAAAMYLRKLSGQAKGAAFAYEMSLDRHRYGALTVLDRWSTLVAAFGGHLTVARYPAIVPGTPTRVRAAELMMENANRLLDAAEAYADDVVEAVMLAFQSVAGAFAEERAAADQCARLGALQPEEFKEARGIFLRDLAAR
jgi:hypothetical protein